MTCSLWFEPARCGSTPENLRARAGPLGDAACRQEGGQLLNIPLTRELEFAVLRLRVDGDRLPRPASAHRESRTTYGLVCELVIDPPSASQLIVASVYGAAAVVPSATAVPPRSPQRFRRRQGLGRRVRRRQVPDASALPYTVTNSMLLLSDMTSISPPGDRTISCF